MAPQRSKSTRSSGSPKAPVDLSLAEAVCLALVVEAPRHGWSLTKELAPEGELGRIWSLSRPLTYRAIDQLESRRLVTRSGAESGDGRSRLQISPTAAGRRAAASWLIEPVSHLRDLRTEFLLKATLISRSGGDLGAFLDAQELALAPLLDELATDRGEADLVEMWRTESARAAQRFFRRVRADLEGRSAHADSRPLRISARNQLRATIDSIRDGEVMSTVSVVLTDGQRMSATITKEASRDLDLNAGDEVLVVIKSTEVMIAK